MPYTSFFNVLCGWVYSFSSVLARAPLNLSIVSRGLKTDVSATLQWPSSVGIQANLCNAWGDRSTRTA